MALPLVSDLAELKEALRLSNNLSNCPFYGYSCIAFPEFINSSGNQCGLLTATHAPCRMEIENQTPDWRTCPVLAEFRGST